MSDHDEREAPPGSQRSKVDHLRRPRRRTAATDKEQARNTLESLRLSRIAGINPTSHKENSTTERQPTDVEVKTDELQHNAELLVIAADRLIRALVPPTGDPIVDADNPYADDTPAAAEARLRTAHEAEQAAHAIGRMLAMREIDAGHVSQRRAAEIFHVAPMTMNRAYREHQATKAAATELDL